VTKPYSDEALNKWMIAALDVAGRKCQHKGWLTMMNILKEPYFAS
jgi:hypothetical protein